MCSFMTDICTYLYDKDESQMITNFEKQKWNNFNFWSKIEKKK